MEVVAAAAAALVAAAVVVAHDDNVTKSTHTLPPSTRLIHPIHTIYSIHTHPFTVAFSEFLSPVNVEPAHRRSEAMAASGRRTRPIIG